MTKPKSKRIQETIARAMPWSGLRTWVPTPGQRVEVGDSREERRVSGVSFRTDVTIVHLHGTWPSFGVSTLLSECRARRT